MRYAGVAVISVLAIGALLLLQRRRTKRQLDGGSVSDSWLRENLASREK
jgi:hypothetical protein